MYRSLRPSLLLSSILAISSLTQGDDIRTCVNVQCPTVPSSTSANCKVVNQTFTGIGIVDYTVPVKAGGLELSWTVGIEDHILEEDQYRREIERVFYLGTSPDIDLTSPDLEYAGCGFFITLPDNKNVAYDANPDHSLSPTCASSLGTQCVLGLSTELASAVNRQTQSSASTDADACSTLAYTLQSSIPSTCPSQLSLQITGLPLTGPSANPPITSSENRTSNCHPTLPRRNQLTRIASYKIAASVYVNETAPALLGETPIMSVFWKKNDTTMESSTVNFECLFASFATTASENTKFQGNETAEDEEGVACRNDGSGLRAMGIVLLAAVIMVSV